MTYEQAVKRINSLLRFGIKPGLERIQELLHRLGDPQESLSFIHVAGTNGKGTTCTLLSSVLQQAGYRTGLFTSPYVTEFRERFQINGEMIPKDQLAGLLDEILPVVENMAVQGKTITEFELITALALVWFAREHCDMVVLEVGLGGRFDATNVIPCPLLAVICSISLDHTAVLGDTIQKIAFEKAGIIKHGGVTVVYPQSDPAATCVISQAARERGNHLVFVDPYKVSCQSSDLSGSILNYRGLEITLPFLGEHQVNNASTVLTAVEVLREKGIRISDQDLQIGFAKAKIPARMEILGSSPVVLLDGGHNPEGAMALSKVVKKYLPGKKIVAIMGMMADKDSRSALSYIAPLCSQIITLQPENPRSLTSEELAKVASDFCPRVEAMHNGEQAFQKARSLAGKDGAILICGSFFLAGEMRPLVQRVLSSCQN